VQFELEVVLFLDLSLAFLFLFIEALLCGIGVESVSADYLPQFVVELGVIRFVSMYHRLQRQFLPHSLPQPSPHISPLHHTFFLLNHRHFFLFYRQGPGRWAKIGIYYFGADQVEILSVGAYVHVCGVNGGLSGLLMA